ncbi:MAG: alpha/beta fold hydrolase [Alphaproteobacteria bacterium]|nr:alpha/beta fold hydrolase [Alphaproteobacteria bacterium]
MSQRQVFEAKDFALQKGGVLPAARLVYRTLGTLAPARDNVVLIPSWYSGTDKEAEFCMVGPGRAIDPARHYVVFTNLLCGGVSSSPSNTPAPFEAGRFPRVTLFDNVRLQHMLLTQRLGIERLRLVTGWSMGGCQSFQWGAQYPDMMQAIAPLCCSARTANFNKVFLFSLRRALELDPAYADGFYTRPPVRGLKAFATIYAGWGFSEPFFRTEGFRLFGAATYAEFVQNFWENAFLRHDANDLLALLQTWHDGDISDNPSYGGDLDAALGAIKARTIIMPGAYDSYFPPVDSQYEASRIAGAECRVIDSIWGHMTLWNPADQPFIDAALAELLRD